MELSGQGGILPTISEGV